MFTGRCLPHGAPCILPSTDGFSQVKPFAHPEVRYETCSRTSNPSSRSYPYPFYCAGCHFVVGLGGYPASEVSYSNQQTSVNQWLIEFRNDEATLQLTMRYRRTQDGGSGHSNVGFGISLDQLDGLTREQVMSAAGNVVRFQMKRDAGTFNFEGWFKEGNGSGHFTFSPSSSFAADLNRQVSASQPTTNYCI